MKAIVIEQEKLVLRREVETPQPGPGQARVRIRAGAVNRADLLQRIGKYPAPPDAPKDIPGLEIAGEVDAIGEGVIDVKVGDRVFGIVSGGGYAEAVVVHARTLAPIPIMKGGNPLGWNEAAALPEATLTAYDAMVLQGGLSAGETVLVHAVGSGVGTAAVQIARAIGAKAIGTARTKDKLDRAAALGMTQGIVVAANGSSASGASGSVAFSRDVRAITPSGVNVVLELVGGAYISESIASLGYRGRLVLVGMMAGNRAPDLDFGLVLRQRLRIFGTVLRSRPIEEKIVAAQVLAKHITPLIESGQIVPIIDKVFPLAEATAAMDYMASNASFGKIVLTM